MKNVSPGTRLIAAFVLMGLFHAFCFEKDDCTAWINRATQARSAQETASEIQALREALRITGFENSPHCSVLDILLPLVRALRNEGDENQALGLMNDAWKHKATWMEEGSAVGLAELLRIHAALLARNGTYDEAEERFHQALALLNPSNDVQMPVFADALLGLARLYATTRQDALAEQTMQRVLALTGQLSSNHLDLKVQALTTAARINALAGNSDAAIALVKQALNEELTSSPRRPKKLQHLYQMLGTFAIHAGKTEVALKASETALSIETEYPSEDIADTITLLLQTGEASVANGNTLEAEPLFRRARDLAETHLGATHLDFGRAWYGLGRIYSSWSNLPEAVQAYEHAMEVFKALGAPARELYVNALTYCIRDLYRMENHARAAELNQILVVFGEKPITPEKPTQEKPLTLDDIQID